jgi:hypothetical protein
MSNTEKEINSLNQFIQNRIIDIDNDIENLEEQIKKLKFQRKKECEKFKKVEEMIKLCKEIQESEEEEEEESEYSESEWDEEYSYRKDYSKEVEGWEKNYGMVVGETLKIMAMGNYFNKCDIDEDEIYDITFYYNKEEKKDLPGWRAECYFSIDDLSDKVFYVDYNTSSRFACEFENIAFQDEEENEEDE